MNPYACDHCGAVIYFDNVQCLGCGHVLSFVPDECRIAAMRPIDGETWRIADNRASGQAPRYRLCRHYRDNALCNWAICEDDPDELCASCRLTTVIPALYRQHYRARLYTVESAKRRLILNLRQMALPMLPGETDHPLRFVFTANPDEPSALTTGHRDGLITVSLDKGEALPNPHPRPDAGEPQRTVLARLRRESGHHYWDEAFSGMPAQREAFRELFGDEGLDHEEALARHHASPRQDWHAEWISSHASAHPLEDWAETWAHYMHLHALILMADALVPAPGAGVGKVAEAASPPWPGRIAFDTLMTRALPLMQMVNELNRSLGHEDAHPFSISPQVEHKLRFVHDTVQRLAVLG